MLIAKRKRKENIIEYILYLYQVEDLIRAFNLDMEMIRQKLIPSYRTDATTMKEIEDWYANLVEMMKREHIEKTGHLQFLKNLASDVEEFHMKLMETRADESYIMIFERTAGLIGELQKKNPSEPGDVGAAIDGVYGYLILKIQNRDIAPATHDAIRIISHWLGILAQRYSAFETGDFEF